MSTSEIRSRLRNENLQEMINAAEVWKPVLSLGHTCASSTGRVRNARTGRIYSQYNHTGYLAVKIAGRRWFAHRLVMEAFHGPSVRQVNHLDGDKKNNVIGNLEYTTNQQNVQHAYNTGLNDRVRTKATETYRKLHADGRVEHAKGVEHYLAKLNPHAVRAIRTSTEPNAALAARFGVSRSVVRDVKNRKTWKHVA